MGVKISDATPKGSSDGTELLAVSDSLTAKSITTANIKDYTIDAIEAIAAAGSVTGSDGVFINQAGATLKPVDIDLVAQHGIDIMWGKSAEATPVDADTMLLKDDGSVEKTVLLSVLAEYIRSAIEGDILDVSDLPAVVPTGAEHLLITDGTTPKQCTFTNLNDAIYGSLSTHVDGLAAVAVTADADTFYVIQGGTGKNVELSQIVAHIGSIVTVSGSTTENYIPQWTAGTDELKEGLLLTSGNFGAGLATSVPSTLSARTTMDDIVNDATDIGADLADGDEILVYDTTAAAQKKSTFTRVWTWIVSKLEAVTDLTSYSWFLDDDTMTADSATKTASQQSIKAYVDNNIWDGDITDIDLDGGDEIGAALVDADLILVDDGGAGTNKNSLVSRIWTYIQTKLAAQYVAPGTGISGGSGTVCAISTDQQGSLFKTKILLDLTDLHSTASGDIIGVDGTSNPCYITQITVPLSGTIRAGKITCIEAPVGGTTDIDLYAADEGTGTEDDPISGLTATILINHGTWSVTDEDYLTGFPTVNQYLYLVAAGAGDADYTAGIFLIELWGE